MDDWMSKPHLARCSACGRKTWEPLEVGAVCGMPQPNGTSCTGRFASPVSAVLPVETPPDVLIAALSDTVDRLPFVVEQRDGDRVWMLRFPGGERQAREATYAEAMLWLALRIDRLERRDRGAPHTFEAGPLVKPTPQSSPTAGPGPWLKHAFVKSRFFDYCGAEVDGDYCKASEAWHIAAPPPSTGEPALPDCLRTMTPEELAKFKPLTDEQIQEALERGRQDYAAAEAVSRGGFIPARPAPAPPRKTPGELAREWLTRLDEILTAKEGDNRTDEDANAEGIAFLERAITADRGGR
jgi:hypothetical protein